jgi:Tfp pilus assembly protein FimV
LGDRNSAPNPPVGGHHPHGDNVDVQQHTQQLLKQWHRQRQVQKMLYLQQKKHKKQQQQPHVLAPEQTTTTATTMIPPVPTFTSAAVGQPSALSAETLMALIDELLRRHVGSSDAPRPCAESPQDKKEKAQPGSKRRHRVPPEHLQVLEEVFAAEPFPHAEAKNELALRLGMTKRSITIWFQNKRARLKRNDEEMSPSSSSSARSPAKSDTGIVFHQLTVDTSGQLAIIPEFPLQV